jgi:hypothetical protein
MLKAGALSHGGIMVNYQCTAACRHCLYACSPTRAPGYITGGKVREIGALLRRAGCTSVHIGGGEPFLDFEGLLLAVRELRRGGISVEYVETNAFWAGEGGTVPLDKLKALLDAGADTLCISLDPYHAEYVPYGYPLRLARLCGEAGMGYFLWKQEFLRTLSEFDPERTHGRTELAERLGADYINRTARAYGIRLGGRASNIETAPGPSAAVLADNSPCGNLLSGGHFHVDKDGFFIPSGCTGLRVPLADLLQGIPPGTYPVFEALYHQGLGGLLSLARESGFVEDPAGYPSRCALCFQIRRRLAEQGFAELDPNHYEESFKYT